MANVLIVAYLLIVLAMIAVILLQRSEGGALGIGGSTNSFMTVRGSANVLTRTTAILAALFFATAIGLTVLSEVDRGSRSILQQAADSVGSGTGAETNVLDALNQMNGSTSSGDQSLALPEAPPATTTTTAPAQTPAPAEAPAPATTPAPVTTPAPAATPAPAETPAPAGGDPALAVPATPATPAPGN